MKKSDEEEDDKQVTQQPVSPTHLRSSDTDDKVEEFVLFRFTKSVPDLRRLVDTLSTLIKMAFKVNFVCCQFLFKLNNQVKSANCQVIDKAEGNPDRVEVETSQLIFKVSAWNQFIRIMCICNSKLFPHKNSQGIFTSGEELVMTVLPILDFLPQVFNFNFLLLFGIIWKTQNCFNF